MKIVVIGGTGLVGAKVVQNLRDLGHEATAAAVSTGVNSVTGVGLDAALAGAAAVVDVVNSPTIAEEGATAFFTRSTENLLAAGRRAGVRHHLVLSIAGVDRVLESGYLRAKLAQEALIKASGIPYTIRRSTPFLQPVAADDVAAMIAKVVTRAPANETMEIAGPERFILDELVRRYLKDKRDPRRVIADIHARYFGAEIDDRSLTPGENPHIGSTSFATWFRHSMAR